MTLAARLDAELEQFKRDGVYKRLNYLEAPQAARTKMQGRARSLGRRHRIGAIHLRDVHSTSRARERAREIRRLRVVAQLRQLLERQ